MEENVLISMLADNVSKWNKLIVDIEQEKSKLIQGEDKLFISLRDFWKKNDFAPDKCKQLLNEIAKYKNKHPASDLKENLQEFRGLCNNYYTKDKAVFEAFQKAMGGKKSPVPKPSPKTKPKANSKPKSKPQPSPKREEQNQSNQKSARWIIKLLPIVILCTIIITVIVSVSDIRLPSISNMNLFHSDRIAVLPPEHEVIIGVEEKAEPYYGNMGDSKLYKDDYWIVGVWTGYKNDKKVTVEFDADGNLILNNTQHGKYTINYENVYLRHRISCEDLNGKQLFEIGIDRDSQNLTGFTKISGLQLNEKETIVNGNYFATTKAFFYNEPNENTIRKAYLAEGDVVTITKIQNGFGYTVFTNAKGQVTEGWIKMNDLQPNSFVEKEEDTEANFTGVNLKVGQFYQGGIIAYINETGKHGLIAASEDQSTGVKWFNDDFIATGATETEIGSGRSNTQKIVRMQGDGNYAAKLCDDLVLNGYDDWFLPSKEELNMLYQNRDKIGGFSNSSSYFSSSENSSSTAWYQYFGYDRCNRSSKDSDYRVRAIRYF